MYLLDTNVVSEIRKGSKANRGVQAFASRVEAEQSPVFVAATTVGELRRGVEALRHRGDRPQAQLLGTWLDWVVSQFATDVVAFDEPCAQVWGRLMVPHATNPIDKQIAAVAIVHQLTVVTRNVRDFQDTGARILNPFTQEN